MNKSPNQNKKIKPPKFNVIFWIYIPLFAFLIYMVYFGGYQGGDPQETEWYKVKDNMISQGDVEKITYVVNKDIAEVTIKKDSLKKYVNQQPSLGIA